MALPERDQEKLKSGTHSTIPPKPASCSSFSTSGVNSDLTGVPPASGTVQKSGVRSLGPQTEMRLPSGCQAAATAVVPPVGGNWVSTSCGWPPSRPTTKKRFNPKYCVVRKSNCEPSGDHRG